jgi:uncharacterized protein (DUF4415 family)
MKMEKDDIKQYSLENLRKRHEQGEGQTRRDAPARALDDEFWQHAQVHMPPGKASVHLRLDADVLEWFRAQGRGHLTRMNAVLRSYMEAHKRQP